MKTDICIIGGGIMGLAAAYNLSKTSDSEITVLDRYGVGNDLCSSNDANRVFRYSYGNDELYTRMAVESLTQWRQIEQESRQELLIPSSLLLLHGEDTNSNAFIEASFNTLTRLELGAERLDQTDLNRRYPQFKAHEAVIDPHGGVLLASKALTTLRSLSETQGVKFLEKNVRKITQEAQPHLTTSTGETVTFRKGIVTMGPWSNLLLKSSMPKMKPTRQQIVYLKPRQGLDKFRAGSCPVFFTDRHYGLPATGIDGVKVSPKELPEEVDPDTATREVDDDIIADCREACRRFVPMLAEGEVIRTKVCLYDMTDNSDFVLDRDPEASDVVYGYGFSGHGFKFAPLIGKLLADLVFDMEPSFGLERFSANQSKRKSPTIGAHLGKGQ